MMIPKLSCFLCKTRHGQKLAKASWLVLLIAFAIQAVSSPALADWLDDVDYSKLVDKLGSATPNGAGVPISQVEALTTVTDGGGTVTVRSYKPDPNNSIFTAGTDPFGQDVTFIDGSNNACNGSCIGFSVHATTTVGNFYYGNTNGIARGSNTVTLYEANSWLDNVLNLASGQNPEVQNFRAQNFSWVGTFGSDSQDRDALQRFDFMIDRDNVTAVVGLNNNGSGATNPNPLLVHPQLLSHSYNALALGRSSGQHSRGTTASFYGPGRLKPDVVSPLGNTSAATASTSGAVAMLHEIVAGTNAANSETMKAIVMAGATKQEFASFVEPSTGVPNPWGRTTTQPLDDIFGAGELNVYNSYLMTAGGQTVGSTDATGTSVETVNSHGWDYQTVSPGSDLFYNFEIPVGSTATELSIIMSWNVEVTDTQPGPQFSGSESLANLDLAFYDSTTTFLGTLVDESLSTIDNVEHIYQTGLGPGTYTLKVSGATARDFGLAWRLNTLFDVASADFDEDGDIDGADFLTWQNGFGTLLDATHAMGDADGDGDVDEADLALFNSSFGTILPSVTSPASTIPEPTTLALAGGGLLLLFLSHRARKPLALAS